ncbi:MAG: hypothetical protein CMM30_08460 [Rhodospirillaceae bacterium]|nr:hypothetical protein [Rhodospirillaceae bacterium]|tara:strand:+ start:248 stop:1471 length:1224 start_codon:yes stop_codon:yes gene_type:complete
MFYRFWFSKEEEVNKVMAIKKGFTKLFFSFFSILFSTSIFLSEANAAEDVNRYIFVPNRASADIAVIDTVTDELIRRIEVGSVPHQVVVSDKLDKLAVTNSADNTLSIIDLNTFLVVSTVELGEEPEHIAINPSGDVIAVGNIGGGSISFVSLNKGSELKRVSGLYEPHNMTFNSDGSHLFVGNLGANIVSVINVNDARVEEEISIGEHKTIASTHLSESEYQGIINITSTPNGKLGFAAYGEGDVMAIIDMELQKVIRNVELGNLPWRAFASPDGAHMLVPNNGDRTISVFSTKTLEEIARLPGGEDMTGINIGWFDSLAYVISRGENKLIVLDLISMKKVNEIPLLSTPETGVITPDGKKLYVALSSSDEVAVVDVRQMKIVKRIGNVGEEPWGVHMLGAINYCH